MGTIEQVTLKKRRRRRRRERHFEKNKEKKKKEEEEHVMLEKKEENLGRAFVEKSLSKFSSQFGRKKNVGPEKKLFL